MTTERTGRELPPMTTRPDFFGTGVCRLRQHCAVCRELGDRGQGWRAAVNRVFTVKGGPDFECPYGEGWQSPARPVRGLSVPVDDNPLVNTSISADRRYPEVARTVLSLQHDKGANKAALAVVYKAMRETTKKGGDCAMCARYWQAVVVQRYDDLYPRLDFTGVEQPAPKCGPGEEIRISGLATQAND